VLKFNTSALKKAKKSEAWIKAGNRWKPNLRLSGDGRDIKTVIEANCILIEYGQYVSAYKFEKLKNGRFKLALQFTYDEALREAAAIWDMRARRESIYPGDFRFDAGLNHFVILFSEHHLSFIKRDADLVRLAQKAARHLSFEDIDYRNRLSVWKSLANAMSTLSFYLGENTDLMMGMVALLFLTSELKDHKGSRTFAVRISNHARKSKKAIGIAVPPGKYLEGSRKSQCYSIEPVESPAILEEIDNSYFDRIRYYQQTKSL
jgi:hypothetical protein